MRSTAALIFLVACGGSDPADAPPAFTDAGGALELPECGYTVTTRIGSEPPRQATSLLGTDPTPRLVHLGLVGDPRTSVVVQWRTIDETTRATTVRYAQGADLPASALTETVTGIEFGYEVTGGSVLRMHQGHLCGLQPGTTYSYQVGAEGHFSPVYTFRTAPDVSAHPDAEVVLGFVGDSRGGYDVWAQILEQLEQRTPDLVLFSGDAVTLGLVQDEWDEFLGNAEPLFTRVPVVLTNGNHEANAINYYAQFAMPGDQENFGLDFGFAHITVANDSPEDFPALTSTIVDALRADFEASKAARWKLLMHHRPMWSAGRHGPSQTLQENWGPLVDEYGLDLVLNGHDHAFELTKPLRGGAVQASSADGTVYFVAGGAGAPLYEVGTDFWTEYSEQTHGASVIRVRRDQLVLEGFRADGTAIPIGLTKTKP